MTKAYDDGLNAVSNALVVFPGIMTELDEVLYGSTIDGSTENVSALTNSVEEADKPRIRSFRATAEADYKDARVKNDGVRVTFDATSRNATQASIEALLDETIIAARSVAQASQSARNGLDAWVDIRTDDKLSVFAKVTTYEDDLAASITTINSRLAALLSARKDLTDSRIAAENADRDLSDATANDPRNLTAAEATMKEKEIALLKLAHPDPLDVAAARLVVTEKETALEKMRQGGDPLDIRAQELVVAQRANTLSDAREKLENAAIQAPFDGLIAGVSVSQGDTIGASTAVATLVTSGRIAQVALNEVDVAKVRVGQRSTLTFDAVEELSITGQVVEVDALGTVTQGVVTYGIKILFDTADERIRPGMSVSASIVTDAKTDVLLVPNAAIRSPAGGNIVEIPDETTSDAAKSVTGITLSKAPRQQAVEVGVSNDTSTEIVSGLKEGDTIISRTITPSTTTATQGQSLFNFSGGRGATGGGGGNNFRAPAR